METDWRRMGLKKIPEELNPIFAVYANKDWESILFRITVVLLTGMCYADGAI